MQAWEPASLSCCLSISIVEVPLSDLHVTQIIPAEVSAEEQPLRHESGGANDHDFPSR